MYSKEEASEIKRNFWISYGQSMRSVLSSEGLRINWLNYKTGIKNLYFKTDTDNKSAFVSIEMNSKDLEIQQMMYEQWEMFQNVLHDYLEEEWQWLPQIYDANGKLISKIQTKKENISIFRESDWEEIISFLKQRIIALDRFWTDNKEAFDWLK